MKFVMWSPLHYVLMAMPFIILLVLYLLLRKASYRTRYFVGALIGFLSLACIIIRNVDILQNNNWKFDPQALPLQVCHFGNILVFFALVFRNKACASAAWSLNMIAAYASLIFADSLANYSTIYQPRAMTYILGHILIVVGAAYCILFKIVRINLKDYFRGIGLLTLLLIPSLILNPYFHNVVGRTDINYFYLYNSDGVPFEFLYHPEYNFSYGEWFDINYVYTLSVIGIFLVLMFVIYLFSKIPYINDKDYQTPRIFGKY